MTEHPEPELVLQGGGPIHTQITEQIRARIRAGLLRPGDQLPTVRTLAVELAVSPTVVTKAYEDLEREGVLTSEEGSGTFVASASPQPVETERRARLERACAEFLDSATGNGYSNVEVLTTIQWLTQNSFAQTFAPVRRMP
jgi:GntR family transcriptional regulator